MSNRQGPGDENILDPFEEKLKAVLEMSVNLVRPRLKTKSQLAKLQQKLIDYHSNDELVEIIQEVLRILSQILPKPKGVVDDEKPMIEQEEYIKLEETLQGFQARMRSHMKREHQLKLYCDELEAKNKELEESKHQLVISTKKAILDLKRDNQELVSKLQQYQAKENQQQKLSIIHTPQIVSRVRPEDEGQAISGREKSQKSQNRAPQHQNADLQSKHQSSSSRKNIGSNHVEKLQQSLKNKLKSIESVVDPLRSRRGSKTSIKMREHK